MSLELLFQVLFFLHFNQILPTICLDRTLKVLHSLFHQGDIWLTVDATPVLKIGFEDDRRLLEDDLLLIQWDHEG